MTCLLRAALVFSLLASCALAGCASDVNKDAVTIEQCRQRLAMPKDRRPPASDPRVDKDAICENMLSAERAANRAPAKAQASAPSSR